MANPVTRIILSAIDRTKAAFTSVRDGITGIGTAAAGIRTQLSLLFSGLAVAGFIGQIKQSVDAMDAANKSAQKIGTSVENFSALSYAAGLADVPVEDLEKSLVKLSRALDQAKAGTGPAAEAFQRLKIDPKQFKDPSDALLVIADRFAAMPDGVNKTALALALFGKEGARMIPFLNAGRAGIAELTAEAQKLGVVFSTEAAAAAEQFNDNMERLKKSANGLGVSMAKEILPGLASITDAMAQATKDSGLLMAGIVGLGGLGAAIFTDQLASAETRLANARDKLARASTGLFKDSNAADDARKTIAAIEAEIAAEKKQNEERRNSSKATSDELGKNRKAEAEAFKKSTNEQISDSERLQAALQSAFEASIRQEEDYLKQAKKLRDEANGTTPIAGNVESQASANLDAIANLMKLQREAGSASLTSVQEQSAALQSLAGQLDDQILKNDLIKQAKLAEAKALEKAAADEKLRYQELSAQQDEAMRRSENMKAALDGIGKEVSVDIKPGQQTDATLEKMREIKRIVEYLQNTPVSVNMKLPSGASDAAATLRTEALKRGNRR